MGKVINVQMDEDFYNEIMQGGGSSSGEVSTIEYLDVSGLNMVDAMSKYCILGFYAISVKMTINGHLVYMPPSMLVYMLESGDIDSVHSVALDFNLPTNAIRSNLVTTKEYILSATGGLTQEELDAIPRITKEQFYNLEA